MEQYIDCPECRGYGCVDSETGEPAHWETASASECAACDGVGRWPNASHVRAMRLHLKTLLESEPFLAELEDGNYHGATEFLRELRDNPW